VAPLTPKLALWPASLPLGAQCSTVDLSAAQKHAALELAMFSVGFASSTVKSAFLPGAISRY
jgi:hypothetical protein